jgi:hypothetical protein
VNKLPQVMLPLYNDIICRPNRLRSSCGVFDMHKWTKRRLKKMKKNGQNPLFRKLMKRLEPKSFSGDGNGFSSESQDADFWRLCWVLSKLAIVMGVVMFFLKIWWIFPILFLFSRLVGRLSGR